MSPTSSNSPLPSSASSLGARLKRRFFFFIGGLLIGFLLLVYTPSFFHKFLSLQPPSPSISSPSQPLPLPSPSPMQSPLSLYGNKGFSTPPTHAKQIVCVLFSVGEDPELTQKALETLPPEITIALSPHTQDIRYWAQQFHAKGHEILVSLDLEPEGFPLNDPGHNTLLTGLSLIEMSKRISWALEQVPYAIGVTHETGNQFTVLEQPLHKLFQILHAHQLLFLDTMTSPESQAAQVASLENVPLLTIDRPFSHRTVTPDKIPELREQAQQDTRLLTSLPLTPVSLSLILNLPCPEKPILGKKEEKSPAILFVPLSFALQNPIQ